MCLSHLLEYSNVFYQENTKIKKKNVSVKFYSCAAMHVLVQYHGPYWLTSRNYYCPARNSSVNI